MLILACVCSSYGQIKVESQSVLPKALGAGIWYDATPGEECYSMMFVTDNSFDDPLMIKLGSTKEAAIKTLDDLINICGKPEGTDIDFDSGFGYTANISIFKILGKQIMLGAKGYAGTCFIKAKMFEKGKKKINSHKP